MVVVIVGETASIGSEMKKVTLQGSDGNRGNSNNTPRATGFIGIRAEEVGVGRYSR